MSDDPKKATHLEPNDLLTLVRLGKWRAELVALDAMRKNLDAQAMPLVKKVNEGFAALNAKYGIDPKIGEGADDENGVLTRLAPPAALKAVGE